MAWWFNLLMLTLPLSASDWVFKETEVYTPLRAGAVAVSPAAETFILDNKECQILKVDPSGELVQRFGKKGKGPGEFQFPGNLMVFKDRVYVLDFVSQTLLAFDLNGQFVTSWKTTGFRNDLEKVDSGWVYGSWGNAFQGAEAGSLNWVDDALENQKVIFDFADGRPQTEAKDGALNLEIKDGYATIPFNPAPDNPRIVSLPDGKIFALFHPGSQLKVHLYDGTTGKLLKQLEETGQAIPFNKQWGEALVEKRNKQAEEQKQAGGFKTRLSPNFPDVFPYIRDAWAHADGKFYIVAWTGNPASPPAIRAFDAQGVFSEADLTFDVASRLFHLTKTHGWVGIFDDEEEMAGVAKVPRGELAAFVKANPINDVERAAVVMVMD